jgi:putative transposase
LDDKFRTSTSSARWAGAAWALFTRLKTRGCLALSPSNSSHLRFPKTTHRFLVHDRDGIYSPAVDGALHSMGLRVLKTPVMAPQANAYCERVIGTARRECLDWVIPLNERHLRRVLTEWVAHYNRGRPHAALGPGLPDNATRATVSGHQLSPTCRLTVRRILGGLHHEYGLETVAA